MDTSSSNTTEIRCHYDILNVPQDANANDIKKAYRKLALKLHPDKNFGNQDDNVVKEKFRLVQEAYECLSDPQERSWYDSHRDAILKGWSSSSHGDNNDDMKDIMLFNVVPYQHPSCYSGYSDSDERSFYNVYQRVFDAIVKEEHEQNNLPSDFGNSTSEWSLVKNFYQYWESFSSTQSFAWVDVYRESTDHRRQIRRAMGEENKRARRAAKKERNSDIFALVHFCKRRDPRVKEFLQQQEKTKAFKEAQQKEKNELKRAQTRIEREEWKRQAQFEMEQAEKEDLAAGRVRLADLDSEDDDDHYHGKKKKKRGKKKRGKKKKRYQSSDDEKDKQENSKTQQQGGEEVNDELKDGNDNNHADESTNAEENEILEGVLADENNKEEDLTAEEVQELEEESSSEEEPDVWRCVACRKDFKSKGQMENHLKSKKHKEAYRKYEKKLEKEAMIQVMMDDLDIVDQS